MGFSYIATCSSCKFESDHLLHGQGEIFDGGGMDVLLDMKKQTLLSKRIYGVLGEFEKSVIPKSQQKKPTKLDPERYKIYGEDPSLGPFNKKGVLRKMNYDTQLNAPNHFYVCPKCGEKTLRFIRCGLWD